MLSVKKRVASLAALSVFAIPFSFARALKSETHSDIIEKARNLVLQKDRKQALLILNKAIQKETKAMAIVELKQTISDVGHTFLSDKAQQLYETSIAYRKTDLNLALESALEAGKVESENFSILSEISRVYIAKGDCKLAEEQILKQGQYIEYDEELRLSLAQAMACQKKWQEVQRLADKHIKKKSENIIYWLSLEAQRALQQKNYVKTQEYISLIAKTDERFPEIDYLKWKLSFEQKRKQLSHGQKYLMTCKNISANQHRQYMIDPNLCRRVVDVDKELKGLSGISD